MRLSLFFLGRVVYWEGEAGGVRMQKKRRILEWPPEAVEIATGKGHPIDKCAELIRVSGHERRYCWRFLEKYGIERPPSQRRNRFPWPEQAAALVAQRATSPVALCVQLMRISGKGEKACWRFLEKHGIHRPGSTKRTTWSDHLFERVLEYVAEHGMQEASQKFNISTKSISNVLYRREHTGLAHEALTLRDLCLFLRVRPKTVVDWVNQGFLEAEQQLRKDGRIVYRFHHDAIKRFCTLHPSLLTQRRWPKQRLEFCEKVIFAPKHAELIDGREAKREREAFREQEERERKKSRPGG